MNLTDIQWTYLKCLRWTYLKCLRWAKVVKEYDKGTRREYKWEIPTILGGDPAPSPIRVNVLNALCDRKLVRWIPRDRSPGYYCLTAAGRKLVNDTLAKEMHTLAKEMQAFDWATEGGS